MLSASLLLILVDKPVDRLRRADSALLYGQHVHRREPRLSARDRGALSCQLCGGAPLSPAVQGKSVRPVCAGRTDFARRNPVKLGG